MALIVDNEPLSLTCNSYASIEEMSAYVEERSTAEAKAAWDALSPEEQAKYLVNMSRLLDSLCEWEGDRYYNYPYQVLAHPRYNLYIDGRLINTDATVFPRPVVEATCEMVIWSMANDGAISVSQNSEFDSIKVGPLEIDFNEGAGGTKDKYFPDIVALILRGWGTFQNPLLPGSKQIRTVRLLRA
jgi:hypothetical protein